MTPIPKVFVDSDVIVSSLISQSGAAYLLINDIPLQRFFSSIQRQELSVVADRLSLDKALLDEVLANRFEEVDLSFDFAQDGGLVNNYRDYAIDSGDVHIIAGAVVSKALFLITYNTKHYKTEKVKRDFNIAISRPAHFLQYLRSRQ